MFLGKTALMIKKANDAIGNVKGLWVYEERLIVRFGFVNHPLRTKHFAPLKIVAKLNLLTIETHYQNLVKSRSYRIRKFLSRRETFLKSKGISLRVCYRKSPPPVCRDNLFNLNQH